VTAPRESANAEPANAGLSVSNLTVRYGTTVAVDSLDLTVGQNELFVLLGGSGSGKTTLLRAIAGFAQPVTGRILLHGADLTSLPPHRRPVNMMFQSYALFPHLSVAANIGFGLRQRGVTRAEARQRVADMLALVRMQGFEARRPTELSGGQQQRVALARSLAPRPDLLLLDEPMSALDEGLRRDTRAELVRLRRALGLSFVLVTHDQEEALALADRIGIMHNGRMQQVGPPATLYEHPANRFVAEFLGAANILPCVIDGTTAYLPTLQHTIRVAEQRWPRPRWSGPRRSGAALLGLRAERICLGATGSTNTISGIIEETAYAGDCLLVSVRIGDGSIMRVRQSLADGFAAAARVGTEVQLGWEPEACMVMPTTEAQS
jgi:ABC-type Fe3+/spermidine/putrescine transport system ATPase subunit